MASRFTTFFDWLNQRWALRRWEAVANVVSHEHLSRLRSHAEQAWALRKYLDRVIHQAEYRLALPTMGTHVIRRPIGTDWAWRPDLWLGPISKTGHAEVANRTTICERIALFHDSKSPALTVRQVRNTEEKDIAPFGFCLDVFQFDGSFLSLAVDLPQQAIQGLSQRHIFRVDMVVDVEKPLAIFARLNIKHGPNVEAILREFPLSHAETMVEFDLGYSKINEKRIEKAWLDLIFDGSEMNQVILRDVTLTRRPRAQL